MQHFWAVCCCHETGPILVLLTISLICVSSFKSLFGQYCGTLSIHTYLCIFAIPSAYHTVIPKKNIFPLSKLWLTSFLRKKRLLINNYQPSEKKYYAWMKPHKHTHTNTHTQTHTNTQTHKHTNTQTHTQTHTHKHTLTHTQRKEILNECESRRRQEGHWDNPIRKEYVLKEIELF